MTIALLTSSQLDNEAERLVETVYDAESVQMFRTDRQNPFQRFFGVWYSTDLIGLGGYAVSPATTKIIELNWAIVRPDIQGQGVGETLLHARMDFSVIEAEANAWPLEGWLVETLPSRLYLSVGRVVHQMNGPKSLIFIPHKPDAAPDRLAPDVPTG
jgi:GNAT superfamily N-acetyltransferase